MTEAVFAIQGIEDGGVSSWTMGDAGFSGHGFQFAVFDLDTKTGELRKEGRLVHLRNQPFQVLSVLLDRAGDLVTREEIKTALWADNVDVDVEQGLNYCVKEIRSALGDNADAPRFIQTLPRRGYRFLGDVRRVGAGPTPTGPKVESRTAESSGGAAGNAVPVAAVRKGRGWVLALGVSTALVALIAMVTLSTGRKSAPVRDSAQPRLVILPFTDLSAVPEGYLADGLTDELIGSLGRHTQGRLGVIARSSAITFRSRAQNAATFARELGASYFIEGTVRRDGSTVRVRVSLARTGDGTQVWSETYDRNIGDLLALEREVVGAIGSGVRVAVNTETGRRAAVDSEAYLDYLKGRFEWNKRNREGLFESLRIFESLTKRFPDFALGWAGMADAYAVLMDHGYLSPKDSWIRARNAAEKAVTLDPGLPEAWTNLGMIRGLYEWNSVAAEEAFAKAAELDPNYSTRLHWQSILDRTEGRNEKALENLRKARDLDPLSLVIRTNLGGVLLELGREKEALAEVESVVSVAPDWGPGLLLMGEVLEHLHRMDGANAAFQKAGATDTPVAKADLAAFYARTGRPDLATRTLKDLENQARTSYVSPYLIAVAAAGVDRESAFRAIEAAFQERSPALRHLRRDPRFNPIREDPRFERLVRVLWPGPSPRPENAPNRQ